MPSPAIAPAIHEYQWLQPQRTAGQFDPQKQTQRPSRIFGKWYTCIVQTNLSTYVSYQFLSYFINFHLFSRLYKRKWWIQYNCTVDNFAAKILSLIVAAIGFLRWICCKILTLMGWTLTVPPIFHTGTRSKSQGANARTKCGCHRFKIGLTWFKYLYLSDQQWKQRTVTSPTAEQKYQQQKLQQNNTGNNNKQRPK